VNINNDNTNEERRERAILIGLNCEQGQNAAREAEQSLIELAELVETAGAEIAASVLQNRQSPDSAWFIGKGKLDEIRLSAIELQADTLVFDDELSGSQIRNIERETGLKVLDRTFVILDIFAGRAQTREGKLQVELAQLQYRLSRLIGTGQALSRLGGGIGTRGPGETQLETDRRHINRRLNYLKQSLRQIEHRRERTRSQRKNQEVLVAAVVGYTNAGKTSLMNSLCMSDLVAMDQVFATLDPIARKLCLPDGQMMVLVDTVGFIRKLPHHLIDAFKATLEEVSGADIIIHVTDASDPDAERQIEIVLELLEQLEALSKPRIHVLNKIDLLKGKPRQELLGSVGDRSEVKVIPASARTGKGKPEILSALTGLAELNLVPARLLIPYDQADSLRYIHKYGLVEKTTYLEQGIELQVRIKASHYGPLHKWIVLAEKLR
jgi:GTP-binding protein HflX